VNRRQFAQLALGAPTASRLSAQTDSFKPADYTIDIAPYSLEVAPHSSIRTVAYNSQVPGPLIRLQEGKPATGFNGLSWTDTTKGHPQTGAAHVTERFTRRDFGSLEIGITIDDPNAYTKPWSAKVPAKLLPDTDLIETYCENEKDQAHKR
jgi:hypothetical protein